MKITIEIPNLLELDEGYLSANTTGKNPCLLDSNSTIHIVVSRDLTDSHCLKTVDQLAEVPVTNLLAQYADADLKAELEDRGYRVAKRRQF